MIYWTQSNLVLRSKTELSMLGTTEHRAWFPSEWFYVTECQSSRNLKDETPSHLSITPQQAMAAIFSTKYHPLAVTLATFTRPFSPFCSAGAKQRVYPWSTSCAALCECPRTEKRFKSVSPAKDKPVTIQPLICHEKQEPGDRWDVPAMPKWQAAHPDRLRMTAGAGRAKGFCEGKVSLDQLCLKQPLKGQLNLKLTSKNESKPVQSPKSVPFPLTQYSSFCDLSDSRIWKCFSLLSQHSMEVPKKWGEFLTCKFSARKQKRNVLLLNKWDTCDNYIPLLMSNSVVINTQ